MNTRRWAVAPPSRRLLLRICLALAVVSFGYIYARGVLALPSERIATDIVVFIVGCLLVLGVAVLVYDEMRAWRRG
jgi:hypothetical protein